MLFSSLEFLFLFLPLTVILYFLSPSCLRNTVLLLVSLLFYASGEPKYIFLMLITVLANFLFGFLCDRLRHGETFSKISLIIAVIFNLSLLGFFKYYDFLAAPLPFAEPLGMALPIGISFYTFQALSYVIDVYRGEVAPTKNVLNFSTYVALFPQLIAGPIVRYKDVDEALLRRAHSFERAAEGVRRFSAGLAKKVLLANPAGEMWDRLSILSREDVGVLGAWLGIAFYAFQIYFDFSGYSDMAIGLGKIFGFDFPENFNYPYISKSITEFWRRWHITLSSFFREYVYIPLGGNRKGRLRMYLNLLIVWALTGLWHGAALNFVLWGLYYFLLLAAEKAFLGKLLERAPRVIRHTYSLLAILLGWVIFAADAERGGVSEMLSRLFGIATPLFGSHLAYEFFRNVFLLTVMIIAATPLPQKFFARSFSKDGNISNALCVVSLLLCTAFLVSSGYNPFLYFRF